MQTERFVRFGCSKSTLPERKREEKLFHLHLYMIYQFDEIIYLQLQWFLIKKYLLPITPIAVSYKTNCRYLLWIYVFHFQFSVTRNLGDNKKPSLWRSNQSCDSIIFFQQFQTTPEKPSFITAQQWSDTGPTDPLDRMFYLKDTINFGRRKMFVNFWTETDKLNIVFYCYQLFLISKILKLPSIWQIHRIYQESDYS